MKVWIDQDRCTGDGLCEEICPQVFTLLDDGIAYVRDDSGVMAVSKGRPQGLEGMVTVPDGLEDLIVEASQECPGECIFIEASGHTMRAA